MSGIKILDDKESAKKSRQNLISSFMSNTNTSKNVIKIHPKLFAIY